jgi:hypothetical protein
VQAELAERCAVTLLHIEALDKKAFAAGGLDERWSRVHLGYMNSLNRFLSQLGIAARGHAAPLVNQIGEEAA